MIDEGMRSDADIVESYGLTLLRTSADWSVENGDLALTPDGDSQVGNLPYNAMYRLVIRWRFHEPQLRDLLRTVAKMSANQAESTREFDRLAPRYQTSLSNPWEGFDQFAGAFRATRDEAASAHFGAHNFSGCLLIVISNLLLRFRSDIGRPPSWRLAEPKLNGFSVGQIVVAAANGFRHEDEWSRAAPNFDEKQERSIRIINGCLEGRPAAAEQTLPRCVEICSLLSEGEFDILAKNVLGFAHAVACVEQASIDGVADTTDQS